MHCCCTDIHHLLQSCVTSATDIVYFNFRQHLDIVCMWQTALVDVDILWYTYHIYTTSSLLSPFRSTYHNWRFIYSICDIILVISVLMFLQNTQHTMWTVIISLSIITKLQSACYLVCLVCLSGHYYLQMFGCITISLLLCLFVSYCRGQQSFSGSWGSVLEYSVFSIGINIRFS